MAPRYATRIMQKKMSFFPDDLGVKEPLHSEAVLCQKEVYLINSIVASVFWG